MSEITIPYGYEPRWYQRDLYNCLADGKRRACIVWHRRAGKDKTVLNLTIKEAMRRVGVYYYFLPTYTQGKKIIWDGIDGDGFKFLNHFPEEIRSGEPNSTEMKINFRNGSIFQVIGTDNFNSIVGPNPIGCVFSEYSLQNPTAWELVRPILAENRGWAIFVYTPRGHNHGWDMWQMAKNNPDWLCELRTIDDTVAISKEAIEQCRREGMSEDMIQQEFYCSFEASISGAYYAKEMRMMKADGRVCGMPADPALPVYTFWDLGYSDYTSIWFVQFVGMEIHICNYYQNCGESLIHYVNYIRDWRVSKGVTLGKAVLPHDAVNKTLQTGKSSYEMLLDMGMECTVTTKPGQKQDGIEACRRLLPRCWIDDKNCSDGIECLTQYRKEFNEKLGTFRVEPVHDKYSHGADAFQTLALWIQRERPYSGGYNKATGQHIRSSTRQFVNRNNAGNWMGN